MSDFQVPVVPAVPADPGLTQMERVLNVYTAPSKTFNDVKRFATWWFPFLITVLAGGILFTAITTKVTWAQIYENNQQNAPQWAKDMQDKQPPEQRAQAERIGPLWQEITWALSPLGLLLIDLAAAGVLLATINFGFGGKARFGAVLAVTLYANLVSWVPKLLLGSIAIFAGMPSESLKLPNVAGTNLGFYLNPQDTSKVLYTLATALDPLSIWGLAVTSIGVAIVAGTKRSSGFAAVFGWWGLFTLIFLGLAAI